jgi:hypothetical protein
LIIPSRLLVSPGGNYVPGGGGYLGSGGSGGGGGGGGPQRGHGPGQSHGQNKLPKSPTDWPHAATKQGWETPQLSPASAR